ncbi:ferric-chelate reductase-like protein [Periconia macrospinosa]|uniref:Ferric-chelate reductase-like protein n=1 Tax=Periconia macrospinosa TaxID=97972 RepID=A0A2V1E3H7_9PLEO|nr:ferric-chelate reductase-like protein [Periconia macrospinosa]
MRANLLSTLLVTGAVHNSYALRPGKWCLEACELNLNYAEFNDTDLALGSHKSRACRSRLRTDSLYLCIDEFCEVDGRAEWLSRANETCMVLGNASLPSYDAILRQYPPEERILIQRLYADEALTFPTLNEVLIPEETFHERAFMTLEAAFYEYDIHLVYGWAMFYFWAAVLAIGMTNRLAISVLNLRKQGRQSTFQDTPEAGAPNIERKQGLFIKFEVFFRRYISIPATFNKRCSEPIGWCTIPSRIQSLAIFLFVLLNIILCTVDYRTTEGNLYWPQKSTQLWRFVSDRTGIISLANFPLIWLFGMRNNVLMWLTGWGYGTYNNFHRWVARVSTVEAVIHSIGYTVMIHERGGWVLFRKYLYKHYFWNGELATIFMCAVLAFSVYGLRRSHYETFLILHIVLSIVVLFTMYYHVAIFTTGEWNRFIYPCVAVWFIDRVLRAFRIFTFNIQFWNTKAIASYDADSNLVKLDVPCENNLMEAKPGTYYYIYVLDNLLYAHQNHPFTVAYINTGKESSALNGSDNAHSLLRPSRRRTNSTESRESDSLLPQDQGSPLSSLVFLIRPYDGFTSRLAKKTSLSPKNLRVLIEGPYGHSVALQQYRNVLFIVGGTGIAVPLSHLSAMLSNGSSAISIRIVWAVREHALLLLVIRDFGFLFEDERVQLEVHVTQDEEDKDDLIIEAMKNVTVQFGRPNVPVVIKEAGEEVGQERLAIVACGPGQMADQARQSCVDLLAQGHNGVEHFEESFKW